MWLNSLRRRWLVGERSVSVERCKKSKRRQGIVLRLEHLEDRTLPSVFTPTTFSDGNSGGGQINTLRDAVNASNNDTGKSADIIQLSAGTHRLDLGQLSLTNASHPLIIEGQGTTGANATTIDQTTAVRVFQIAAAGAKVEFENLVIYGGDAQNDGSGASGPTNARGGGILNNGGNLTLSNVVMQSNEAVAGAGLNADGGGIYSSGGSLTILGSTITGNAAFGGAGAAGTSGTKNLPTGGNGHDGGSAAGGGLYVTGATVTMRGSTLFSNVAYGGRGGNGGNSGDGFNGTSGSGGTGGAAVGGGIYATDDTLQFSTNNFYYNAAGAGYGGSGGSGLHGSGGTGGSGSGGGLYVSASKATLSHDRLHFNEAFAGGGGSLYFTYGKTSSAGNGGSAGDSFGGGMYVAGGVVTLTNSTLSRNLDPGGNGGKGGNGGNGGNGYGGGAAVVGGTVAFKAGAIEYNTAQAGAGGAPAPTGGAPTLGGYFSGGAAGTGSGTGGSASGGGLYTATGVVVTLDNTKIDNNTPD